MKYLKMLLYENVAFLAVSFYLVYTAQAWGNYDTFAFLTGGGGAKWKMVSALGQFEEFEKELERISRLKEKLEE